MSSCRPAPPWSVLACLALAASVAGAAQGWQPGERLPAPLQLRDQHERPLPVPRDTRLIFLAAEMEASKLMGKALEGLPPSALQSRRAVYIADISNMPEPISTIVAVPRLQQLPYPVAVVRHAGETARLPRQAGAVTVLQVVDGRVAAVEFARSPEAVGKFLK